MLRTLVALLVASVVFVPLSRRAGFGSVLGYLVAGAAIGPAGLGLVTDVSEIADVSELGVVMLLFLIGLELRPHRLWVMRRAVFGLGMAQVLCTAALLAVLGRLAGVGWGGAVVLGAGCALSSTAIVLPMLAERDLLQGRAGRDAFAVLLLQDLAFIPLVALVPLLAGGAGPLTAHGAASVPWARVAQAAAAITAILAGGRFLLPLVFRAVGGTRTPEVFTATALLVVVGTAFLASSAGLSMSLGAFLAGVLLSNSEYRHELQADIEPFEGLLLGFFFMSVGMAAQLGLLAAHPLMIGAGVAGLLLAKAAVAFALGRAGGQERVEAARFALALPQGSEFSFVLFAAAVAVGALAPAQADGATLVIALSMAATPVLFSASERFLVPRLEPVRAPEYDPIDAEAMPVIICGIGRVGQIVGRVLRMQGIGFVALEKDAGQIDVLRRFGSKVYFGDATRADLLRAAGAEHAQVLVIAVDDMEAALRVAEIARRQFPHLRVVARARNRRHAHLLMDRGVEGLVRETFHSSLRLTELTLDALGRDPAAGRDAVAVFAAHDERALVASHAYYEDETRLIQNAQQQAAELTELFQGDRAPN
ncbi:MAG: monovalent cation:proton antiporter-2 (CPA2) family protein [Janthinobacterium lividum]